MPIDAAPLFTDVHPGPAGGKAYWLKTADGIRIRVGHWPTENAIGTVLLFPGRTEYIEKYGATAVSLAERGLATLAIDWRGQGLADRLISDPLTGHVEKFTDFQQDVSAMVEAAKELDLPQPYFLLAHSMGGCIGLRAVIEGLPVKAAAFSGPMWGIYIAPHLRLLAGTLARVMPRIGKGHDLPPGTAPEPYPLSAPFEDNTLTTDLEMYDMMRDQLRAHPDLSLGGPSFVWLREAMAETAHLASCEAPDLPCTTFVGTNERIVSVPRIHERMDNWAGSKLVTLEGGEHEVLLERPQMRNRVIDEVEKLFKGTLAN